MHHDIIYQLLVFQWPPFRPGCVSITTPDVILCVATGPTEPDIQRSLARLAAALLLVCWYALTLCSTQDGTAVLPVAPLYDSDLQAVI
jgi:hypothetical protein